MLFPERISRSFPHGCTDGENEDMPDKYSVFLSESRGKQSGIHRGKLFAIPGHSTCGKLILPA